MPCVSAPVAQNMAIIQIGVSQSAAWLQQLAQQGQPVQPAQVVWFNALMDTGCSDTCVTQQMAAQAGLPVVGIVQIATAAGPAQAYQFYGDLHFVLPNTGIVAVFPNRVISQLLAGSPTHSSLLGMDVFTMGALAVNANAAQFCW